jgi:hypothetical protein
MTGREPKTPRSKRPIKTIVTYSDEPIALDAWLDRYARLVVEVEAKRRASEREPEPGATGDAS